MDFKASHSLKFRSVRNWDTKLSANQDEDIVINLTDKGELIASCFVRYDHIYNLVVNPKYRKHGFGKEILEYAEKIIGKTYSHSYLIPQDNDTYLRKYYSNFGYVGKKEPYEEEDKDNWVMSKDLRRN